MKGIQPVDFVIALLTISVTAFVFSIILNSMVQGDDLRPGYLDTAAKLFGTILSIISMYVGAMIQRHKDES